MAVISRNQIKYLHSLQIKKFRDLNRAFVVEGVKMVDELLRSHFTTVQVFGTAGWLASRKELLQEKEVYFLEISEEELVRASNLATPNEVVAIAAFPSEDSNSGQEYGDLVLLLDRLQDPGNLGTIIRTADWFGIQHIFCSRDSVDWFNSKVVQSTMGSMFRVRVHYTDLVPLIDNSLGHYGIYAATMDGAPVYDAPAAFPAAIVIGNESQGISRDILEKATHLIGIPSASSQAESLNASVAAGILCAEFTRKLTTKN
jgi:TrmH family RNA methyltransferase